jgi:hypothetical protein
VELAKAVLGKPGLTERGILFYRKRIRELLHANRKMHEEASFVFYVRLLSWDPLCSQDQYNS